MISTYKFYDKNKRLGIFYKDGVITVIPCSNHDQFSRQKSKELFNTVGANKERFEVDNMTQREFIDWCEKKYQKMYSVDIDMNAKVKIISTSKKDKLNGSVLTLKFLA